MPEIKMEMNVGESDSCKGEGDRFDAWWEERSLPQKILLGIGFAVCGIGLLALLGLFVMLLWNWLMPELFGLPSLSYWQAWGLLILCSLLFKNWGVHAGSGGSAERKRKQKLRRYIREGEDADPSPEV